MINRERLPVDTAVGIALRDLRRLRVRPTAHSIGVSCAENALRAQNPHAASHTGELECERTQHSDSLLEREIPGQAAAPKTGDRVLRSSLVNRHYAKQPEDVDLARRSF
ncbi:MAG: hypothetical protein H6880_09600 [Rhodobiaceae bacterium]|nr:hypothetical protein [Rhodobiaceae bacterium]